MSAGDITEITAHLPVGRQTEDEGAPSSLFPCLRGDGLLRVTLNEVVDGCFLLRRGVEAYAVVERQAVAAQRPASDLHLHHGILRHHLPFEDSVAVEARLGYGGVGQKGCHENENNQSLHIIRHIIHVLYVLSFISLLLKVHP